MTSVIGFYYIKSKVRKIFQEINESVVDITDEIFDVVYEVEDAFKDTNGNIRRSKADPEVLEIPAIPIIEAFKAEMRAQLDTVLFPFHEKFYQMYVEHYLECDK